MSFNETENTLRNFVTNAELFEICLKMFQSGLEELHERGIHPKAHEDVMSLAMLHLMTCLNPDNQKFSFEELDHDETEEAQGANPAFVDNSRLPTPGTLISTNTDTNGNGVSQTVSATGQGVHTRFSYSEESATSPTASTSSPIPVGSTSDKEVDKGKGKATNYDSSDSGYESWNGVSHNPVPNHKKRAREDDGDEAQGVRNTSKRPNKPGMTPDPGPSRPRNHPRRLRREYAFYIPPSDEDQVRDRSEFIKPSPNSNAASTSPVSTLAVASTSGSPASACVLVASTPVVTSPSDIVRPPSRASSIPSESNSTAILSPPALSLVPSRARPRGLRREYAFYIPRSDEDQVRDTSESRPSTSGTSASASASASIASTSAVTSISTPVRTPSAASIASNGTTTSPSTSPVANPATQATAPSTVASPSPRRTPKRAKENDNEEPKASSRVLRRRSE